MLTPEKFKQFLRRHGFTQEEFGVLLGHGARTGQYWAAQSRPASVETLAELIDRRPEVVDVLREIAADRDGAAGGNTAGKAAPPQSQAAAKARL